MNNTPNPEWMDEENPEWTEKMFREAKTAKELFPHLVQPVVKQKIVTTMEYDVDIITAFQASGSRWQERMNEALREWLQEHVV